MAGVQISKGPFWLLDNSSCATRESRLPTRSSPSRILDRECGILSTYIAALWHQVMQYCNAASCYVIYWREADAAAYCIIAALHVQCLDSSPVQPSPAQPRPAQSSLVQHCVIHCEMGRTPSCRGRRPVARHNLLGLGFRASGSGVYYTRFPSMLKVTHLPHVRCHLWCCCSMSILEVWLPFAKWGLLCFFCLVTHASCFVRC